MIPTRSRDSRTRSVNSGRAVTHVVEPRRVVTKVAKKYRDAAARGSDAGSPALEEAHQWAVGICTTQCRDRRGPGTEAFTVRCGQVSPRFRGQGPDAARRAGRCPGGRSCGVPTLTRFGVHERHGPLAQLVRAHG